MIVLAGVVVYVVLGFNLNWIYLSFGFLVWRFGCCFLGLLCFLGHLNTYYGFWGVALWGCVFVVSEFDLCC